MKIKQYEKTSSIALKPATVLLLVQGNKVLLAMKKRGFGEGKWNGVGGKPIEGEDIVIAAIREAREEIGVVPEDPRKAAVFKYYFPHANQGMKVWVFTATKWKGKPLESEEMNPKWFNFKDIPYNQMWSDDEIWMPKVLKGSLLKGSFIFNNDGNVVDYYLNNVDSIE